MDEKKPKSQSQITRNILFRIWQKDNKGMDFDTFYHAEMGKIIDALMQRLDDAPLPEDDL